MLKFTPLLLALIYGLVAWRFSTWRLKRELDEKSSELADPRLHALTRQMAQALDLPRIRVNLYEIPAINGLAAPDGRIFLTRGFYNAYRQGQVTAEELASVIAHELGHVALGHSRRRMIDFSGQNALRMGLTMVIGRFIPFVGPMLVNAAMSLLTAKLSRKDEYEADAYAAALLSKAGIGVGPQISLFTKLEALSGARGAQSTAWLHSHPATAERIAAIRALDKGWNARD
ncbi:peptidase M48 [Pseudooceanicola sediminis]|uniref:Peptidase M48 n=1 Tax=Pseudooceanicola sediminis TaxID=2211117 RepID=A0A399J5Q7_9RHOB|nr:M48 family metalloprotease [Pseudooceanicola sediminis]KAA2316808.1 M48 family metalloprotease [Puniceibacterium sp. HSS470]RII40735.1 peptidase M48 [Pseudooceanicola sediminis]|tara:strand:+ start:211126 stop:211815 length:690 start_codon:yes stop_codon:yes gene_type:complete